MGVQSGKSDQGGLDSGGGPPATAELSPLGCLVEKARSHDEGAWRELYDRLSPVLRAVARRYDLGAADVDDVVAMTWVKCFEHIGRLREPRALPGWLVTTCRHESLALIRRRQRCVPVVNDALILLAADASAGSSSAEDPENAVVEREERELLRVAVGALPERQRLLVNALAELDEGQGYQEVAVSLSMPIGSIGPTRGRAVSRLRRHMTSLVA